MSGDGTTARSTIGQPVFTEHVHCTDSRPLTKDTSQPASYPNVCTCVTSNSNILSVRFSTNCDFCGVFIAETERSQLLNVNWV